MTLSLAKLLWGVVDAGLSLWRIGELPVVVPALRLCAKLKGRFSLEVHGVAACLPVPVPVLVPVLSLTLPTGTFKPNLPNQHSSPPESLQHLHTSRDETPFSDAPASTTRFASIDLSIAALVLLSGGVSQGSFRHFRVSESSFIKNVGELMHRRLFSPLERHSILSALIIYERHGNLITGLICWFDP